MAVTIQACSPCLGKYMAVHKKNNWSFNFLQINKDSSYVSESGIEWYSYRSFGTWSPIQGKKNYVSFKSSSSDYSQIPICVRESHKEQTEATIIFTQGKQFYNCEFNEILINEKNIPIDKDTIVIDSRVDSLSIILGFSEWMRRNLTVNILYPAIYTQVYYPLDKTNNVYEITLPIYPHFESSNTFSPSATTLFSYLSEEFEAYYHLGKWFVYGKEGEKIPFKRYRVRKERKED